MTVLDLFKLQVLHFPEQIAVKFENVHLTFSELDRKSSALAQYIMRQGNWYDRPVPICLERSAEMIIGIFAILKSGAGFLPIDPDSPAERINMLISDSGSSICLTDVPSSLKIAGPVKSIVITECLQELPVAVDNLQAVSENQLAYVIYTSGSTGKPKGVMIEHCNLLVNIRSTCEALGLTSCKTFAIIATFSADGAITAIFAALCYGKTLTVFSKMEITDLSLLSLSLKGNPIDCYKVTPTLLNIFLDAYPETLLPKKVLIVGGEALQWNLVQKAVRYAAKETRIFNHYGPTETTVGVIVHEFDRNNLETSKSVPLGRPLGHVQCFILDDSLMPVSEGAMGHLFIGGPSVARGYFNRPDLTNGSFVMHTFNGHRATLYQTGDLAQCIDGLYYFCGRKDDQVKIRGYRVELGEIENAINAHPMVEDSAVVVHVENDREVLAGYFVSSKTLPSISIVQFLRERLPDHMIPRLWSQIDKIPLTSNGKKNRRALPHAHNADIPSEHPIITNEAQRDLIGLWRNFFPHRRIDVNATFFELGGDSLILMRLVTCLSAHYKVRFNQRILFENMTVAKLAKYITAETATGCCALRNFNQFDETEATVFQFPLYFRNKFNPRGTPNSALTFAFDGFVDVDRLEECFVRVMHLHDLLRVHYSFRRGRVYEEIADDISFRIIQIKSQDANIATTVASLPSEFDFANETLMRVFLIETIRSQYLHIQLPHISSDGVSLAIILAQVEAMYNGATLSRGLQYRDFKKVFYAYLHSAAYENDKKFWANMLSRKISARFAYRRNALSIQSGDCANDILFVSPHVDEAVLAFLEGKNLTKFHVLISAYVLCLHNRTGENDIVARIPVNYRDEPGFENIVGLITNTVLVRVDVDPQLLVTDFLGMVASTVLEVLAHGRFPFMDILKLMNPDGDRFIDFVSTYFGYHNQRGTYHLQGAQLKMYMHYRTTEELSLAINVYDTNEGYYIRTNSKPNGYSPSELNAISQSFVSILWSLINSSTHTTLREVFLCRSVVLPTLS